MNYVFMKVVDSGEGLARQHCGVSKRIGDDVHHLVGFFRELPQPPFDQCLLQTFRSAQEDTIPRNESTCQGRRGDHQNRCTRRHVDNELQSMAWIRYYHTREQAEGISLLAELHSVLGSEVT